MQPAKGRGFHLSFPQSFSRQKKSSSSQTVSTKTKARDQDVVQQNEGAHNKNHNCETPSASGELTMGQCMCCLSSLRFPVDVPCFKCTVCQTTNDIVPLNSEQSIPISTYMVSAFDLREESNFDEPREGLDQQIILAFQNFQSLNLSFLNGNKLSYSACGLDYKQIHKFYSVLLRVENGNLMRSVIKASEVLLRRPGKIITDPNDLKFLLIIFENPVLYLSNSSSKFNNLSSLIKRLIGLFSGLNATCHHYLVNWFARLDSDSFRAKVELINSFTTHRLAKYSSIKGGAKLEDYGSDWIIRAAARVLSLFFAANIQVFKIPTSSFYNTLVDYIDITHDFDIWEKQGIPGIVSANVRFPGSSLNNSSENDSSSIQLFSRNRRNQPQLSHSSSTRIARSRPDSESGSSTLTVRRSNSSMKPASSVNSQADQVTGKSSSRNYAVSLPMFTFCQYPFYLSMGSKITILEYDARRQMEIKAREAFFSTLNHKRIVEPHLVLKVRRNCIIEDSLRQISSNEMELKKGLKIEFIGEDGIDAGGLRKEWFLLLVRDMFDPLNGMFIYEEESSYCWFNHLTFETSDQYFLVGVVLGLAIYNSTILDINLPPAVFKKLLGCPCTMDDLMLLRPSLARGLQKLLEFDGDVEKTFCRDFVAEHEVYGSIIQVPLMPGGETTPVTNSNRHDFVNKYIQFIFDVLITRQFQPFKRGFYHVIGGNALTLFRPEEIELLIRGSDEGLDVAALKAVALYDGWGPAGNMKGSVQDIGDSEQVINWFWEIFENMNIQQQRQLLTFITGSDRIPATGIANLIFKISKIGEDSER
ncbi:hypothetical protein V1514DRAFT_339347 [Lipomyces japonicus]|uniref:uncharacterized protein n=1 Tax=Lipomyces japonicus TaxID=56871 RepID=UPI0034CEA066